MTKLKGKIQQKIYTGNKRVAKFGIGKAKTEIP